MQFPFYPKHEHACPNVGHCPHLGGAALGTLVLRANTAGETLDRLHRTLDAERNRNSELVAEKLRLEQELARNSLVYMISYDRDVFKLLLGMVASFLMRPIGTLLKRIRRTPADSKPKCPF